MTGFGGKGGMLRGGKTTDARDVSAVRGFFMVSNE